MTSRKKLIAIIPTYNAEKTIDNLLCVITKQTMAPDTIIIIDSSSTDNTVKIANKYTNVTSKIITKPEFNHGATRQLAVNLKDAEYYIFLTQDAIPANNISFNNLIAPMDKNNTIGCAYGRQLPNKNANPLAKHARLFNYPDKSAIKSLNDKNNLGIKTCFMSNSFAVYRKSALDMVNGFPKNVVLGEDVYVAAKMLLTNWKIAYVADACVYHSHNFSPIEEFRRYFNIGKFHKNNHWILDEFASPDKEGLKFVKSELLYLIKNRQYRYIIKSILSTSIKFLAYKLGKHNRRNKP